MLEEEAKWFGQMLRHIGYQKINAVLNLGSGTEEFRNKKQYYINKYIFNDLYDNNVKVVHTDLQPGEGVDIVGDLYSCDVQLEIKKINPNLILCANILEHVKNPNALAELCISLVEKNGFIIVSVPHNFPYHLAPIDTLYRPTVKELHSLFKGTKLIDCDIVNCGNFLTQLKNPIVLVKHLIKMLLPFPSPRHWLAAIHRNLWLFKDYKISCILIQKI